MHDVQCEMYGVRLYDYLSRLIILKIGFMDSEEMKRRTKLFAINVAQLTQKLKVTTINGHI